MMQGKLAKVLMSEMMLEMVMIVILMVTIMVKVKILMKTRRGHLKFLIVRTFTCTVFMKPLFICCTMVATHATPLHTMLDRALFARDRSKALITTLNRIGVSNSYNAMMKDRYLLMAYTVDAAGEDNVPIPSTFTKPDFAVGGTDSSNYADRSSLLGSQKSNYAASVLFQDVTLTKPLQKQTASISHWT